jgi:hypothetical protein
MSEAIELGCFAPELSIGQAQRKALLHRMMGSKIWSQEAEKVSGNLGFLSLLVRTPSKPGAEDRRICGGKRNY